MPTLRSAIRRLTGRRPPLVVCPVNGLGNRMRAITSADAFARRHGLALSMCWEPGKGFSDIDFESLFASEIPRTTPAEVEALARGGVPRLTEWCSWEGGRLHALDGFDGDGALARICEVGLVYDHAFMDLASVLARIGARGVVRGSRATRRAFRRLRVAKPIADAADRFASEHFAGRRVIGVHVRRGDAFEGPLAALFEASTDAAFEREMDQLLAATPDVYFFLATDDPAILTRLEKRYPGHILATSKEYVASDVDAPKGGQIDALLELTLLSRTRLVLGTEGSTFGQAAARMGGIRFRVAVERAGA